MYTLRFFSLLSIAAIALWLLYEETDEAFNILVTPYRTQPLGRDKE